MKASLLGVAAFTVALIFLGLQRERMFSRMSLHFLVSE